MRYGEHACGPKSSAATVPSRVMSKGQLKRGEVPLKLIVDPLLTGRSEEVPIRWECVSVRTRP